MSLNLTSSNIWEHLKTGNVLPILPSVLQSANAYDLIEPEWNLICALTLEKAGYCETAIDYWDKIARNYPHRLAWLQSALTAAARGIGSIPLSGEYFTKWQNLLNNIFCETPSLKTLELLDKYNQGTMGCVGIHNGKLQGWFWLKKNQKLLIQNLGGANSIKIKLHPAGANAHKVLYRLCEPLSENIVNFALAIKDESGRHINGSPLICSTLKPATVRTPKKQHSSHNSLTIIIPVYDDRRATLGCLGSVFASLKSNRTKPEILVIWDCGPDEKLYKDLERLQKRGKIKLLHTGFNHGFLAAVNLGLANTPGGDVILLNSDTLVHGNWLDRFCAHAARADMATITSLGSDAEHVSYPSPADRADIKSLSKAALIDTACSGLDASEALCEIPVGVGFCMFISRRALNAIGGLDGRFLYKGYGEEVDFSLRAAQAGMKNYAALNIFVAHLGGRSFGPVKRALVAQNNKALRERFPQYENDYNNFLMRNPCRPLIEQISRALCGAISTNVLYVLPWTYMFLPAWEKQKNRQHDKKAALFILPCGSQAKVRLRIWDDIPLADMNFKLPEDAPILYETLEKCGFTKFQAEHNCQLLHDIAEKLHIQWENAQLPIEGSPAFHNWHEMPDKEPYFVPPPASVKTWSQLCDIARQRPNCRFYIPRLKKIWGNAIKPDNIEELQQIDDLRPFAITSQLLAPDAKNTDQWQDWLQSRKCLISKTYLISA